MEAFIRDPLSALKIDCWFDELMSDTIDGDEWWPEIASQIETAPGFTFLFSEAWVKSKICQREYATAKSLGKELFPVQYSNFQVPVPLVHRQFAPKPREVQQNETHRL